MNNENFRAEETENEKDFVPTPRSSELSGVQKRVSKTSKTSRVSSIVETLKSEAGARVYFLLNFGSQSTQNLRLTITRIGQKSRNFCFFLTLIS